MFNLAAMATTDKMLVIDNISVRSINSILFNHLTLTINKGEHWVLTGPSGSGKSALLQTIAGKLNITNGKIQYCFYEDFAKSNPSAHSVTFHQLIALVEPRHHFKNLSNTTDFYYQQRYNSMDSEDSVTVEDYLNSIQHINAHAYWNITNTISLLNLQPLLGKKLIMLSNGETKRLRLASALLKNPLLLLLDNPLAGLDVNARTEFNSILQHVSDSGITIIMTSSPAEIPTIITHIAVLQELSIVETCKKNDFITGKYSFNKQPTINANAITGLIDNKAGTAYTHIVKMQDVSIRYGENIVLKNVNWQIEPGERWALLGPNGAGKSTLLSLINGDNPQAYANNIVLFDKKRGTGESIWDIKKKTGFVSPELFQYFPADNSCLQVIESGYYDTLGLFRPSSKEKQEKALRWMQVLEIDQYSRMLLKNIPAAAQRLCLLARAVIKNPPLLIFDEPCQGLDNHQQQHFKQVIDKLCQNSNVTLIYVTHYQHEIPESVTRILRLDKGEVVS